MGWSWRSAGSGWRLAIRTWDPARYRSSAAAGAQRATSPGTRGSQMDIDLSVLRSLESEKDISMDLAIKAIEDALLRAYYSTTGAALTARVEIDRGSGHVTVWASEPAEEGAVAREDDDTPDGFGRVGGATG